MSRVVAPDRKRLGAALFAATLGLALLAAFGLLPSGHANATSIAVLVNDEPITDYDINQRVRLLEATSGGQAGRSQAVEELVEEKLKLQAARRVGVSVSESEVSSAFANIASSVNLSPSQFEQALGQIGVNPTSLKNRLRADLAWRDVVRGQLRQEIEVRERDVQSALIEQGEAATATSVEFTVREVLFSLPADASSDMVRRREQEANQFRAQFSGCDAARELAQNYRNTVVRSEQRRRSSELPPQLRESLLAVGEGEVSQPNVTERAVELLAVCSRREVQDTEAARADIQDSIANEEGERLARRLMIDLKQTAVIEHR